MEQVSTAECILLFASILLSGFFSGSEAVLMSVGIDRANQLIEEGGSVGRAMKFMVEKPNELLATILVGNNVVNIWASSLTTVIAARIFNDDVIGITVGIVTITILIFGEVIPKTFARSHAETLSLFVIRILQFFYYMTYPLVKSMVWIIKAVLGENAELSGRIVTKDDVEYFISRAEKEKTMDSKQIDLLNSILEFPTIKVKDIMIPRAKIKFIDSNWGFDTIMSHAKEDGHSRYPVCDGELENMEGFLHIKDLMFAGEEIINNFKLSEFLKEPFFVYEHMRIHAVFDHMNRKKVHLGLVKDENGLIVGIITLEDILEEIVGEIQDEHDDDEEHIINGYEKVDLHVGVVVDGTLSLRDLYSEYDLKIPLNDNYSTLAGFILDMLGNNFPEDGQIIVWEGFSFELVKVDDYEIREVRIKDVDGEKHIFSKKEARAEQDEALEAAYHAHAAEPSES